MMGVSIDLHIYDYFELVKDIQTKVTENGGPPEGRSLNEFVEKILPEFGHRAGDKFITLWNEYYEDYNSAAELFRAVDMYFGTDGVFLGGYDWGKHANAREVFADLGIEPINSEDEDE